MAAKPHTLQGPIAGEQIQLLDGMLEELYRLSENAQHELLSSTHTDSEAASPAQGDLIIGSDDGTPVWVRLALGAVGTFLQVSADTLPSWQVDLVPATDDTAIIGSASKKWATAYVNDVKAAQTLVVGGTGAVPTDIMAHFFKGSAGTDPAWNAVDVALFENAAGGATVIQIFSANNQPCAISFSDPDARDRGSLAYRHSSDAMEFKTAGSLRAVIDSTGALGVGTSVPATEPKLHVLKGTAGTDPAWSTSDVLLVENTAGTAAAIMIFTSNAVAAGIGFSDPDARGRGFLLYDHATDAMSFTTAGVANRLTITSAGLFNFATDSGIGIIDTNASHYMRLDCGSDLSADRVLSFVPGDAARTITLSGNPTLSDWFDQSVKVAASPTFAALTVSGATSRHRNSVEQTTTSTGTQDNVSLTGAVTYLRCNNASALTISGFTVAGSAPQAGDVVIIDNVGTSTVRVLHENTGSTAANRIICPSTNGQIIGAKGRMVCVYDDTTDRWREQCEEPGAPIDVAFDAGNFTGSGAMTWTLTSPDQATYQYIQRGRALTVLGVFNDTSVGGTPDATLLLVGTGFTFSVGVDIVCRALNNSVAEFFFVRSFAATGTLGMYREAAGNWTASTNATQIIFNITLPVD